MSSGRIDLKKLHGVAGSTTQSKGTTKLEEIEPGSGIYKKAGKHKNIPTRAFHVSDEDEALLEYEEELVRANSKTKKVTTRLKPVGSKTSKFNNSDDKTKRIIGFDDEVNVQKSIHNKKNTANSNIVVTKGANKKTAAHKKGTKFSNDDNSITPQDYESAYDALQKKYDALDLKLKNTISENIKLNAETSKIRNQLIDKIQQKTKEAKLIIDAKVKENESKFQAEIKRAKEAALETDIINFIDIILHLETAIVKSPDNPAVKNYVTGFNMILNMFYNQLGTMGISQIDVNVGDEFNTNYMEAFDIEKDSRFKSNKIIEIYKKGFVLNDKVIRHTLVKVAK